MPDLDIVIMQECQSCRFWATSVMSSKGDKAYTVTYRGTVWGNIWHGRGVPKWECNCRGYAFRGHCRHIEVAKDQWCGWHEMSGLAQSEIQKKKNICPKCGGETIHVQVDV